MKGVAVGVQTRCMSQIRAFNTREAKLAHRYNAAWVVCVFSSMTASGLRLGGSLAAVAAPRSISRPHASAYLFEFHTGNMVDSPLPIRFPPKPPEPRTKIVVVFSKMTLPVALSLVSVAVVTAAALSLSSTSMMLQHVTHKVNMCSVV